MKKLFLILLISVSPIIEADAQWSPFDWFSKPSFSPEAQQYFARITNPPATDTLRFYSDCIDCMTSKGIYVLIDEFGFLAARNEQMALLGVKGVIDALAVNSPAFEVYRGYTGNGTTSYINTQFVVGTHAVNYTLNNASIGAYNRANITLSNSIDIGASSSAVLNKASFNSRNGSGNFGWVINSNSFISIAVSSPLGLISVRRTASNLSSGWQNGVSLGTSANVSSNVPPVSFYILAENIGGTATDFSTRQISFWYVGGALSDAQMLELFNCIETLMDRIGAGVVN